MFDSDQGAFDQRDSFIGGKQFGWSTVSQDFQRRCQPMCRLLLVAKHGNRVGDYGHEASDLGG